MTKHKIDVYEYVSVRMAANLLGTQLNYIYRRIQDGRLLAMRDREGRWIINTIDLEAVRPVPRPEPPPPLTDYRPKSVKPVVTRELLVQVAHACQRCSLHYNDPDLIEACRDIGESCWKECPVCYPDKYTHRIPVRPLRDSS